MKRPFLLAALSIAFAAITAASIAIAADVAGTVALVAFIAIASVANLLVIRQVERNLSQAIKYHAYRSIQLALPECYAMQNVLKEIPNCTMPVSTWSMQFTHLLEIRRRIRIQRPKLIVELGSGISTIVCAKALSEIDSGKIISIDHSEEWAEVTREHLKYDGLDAFSRIEVVDMAPHRVGSDWYKLDPELFQPNSIDMLIVDGPPTTSPSSRLPAFAELLPFMSAHSTIFLDDANRPEETEIVRHWKANPSSAASLKLETLTGLAVLTISKKPSPRPVVLTN
jgi:predicted O-methyltransferase YrrM